MRWAIGLCVLWSVLGVGACAGSGTPADDVVQDSSGTDGRDREMAATPADTTDLADRAQEAVTPPPDTAADVPCSAPLLAVDNALLNGDADETSVVEGTQTISLLFDWWISNGPDCPDCVWDLVIFVEGAGPQAICITTPPAPLCPGSLQQQFIGELAVPESFGTYPVKVGLRAHSQCLDTTVGELAATASLGTLVVVSQAASNEPPAAEGLVLAHGDDGRHELAFLLLDANSDDLDVTLEYQVGGGNWQPGTLSAEMPATGLPSSPDGIATTLTWLSLADVGKGQVADLIVRVTPHDAYASGTPAQAGPLTLNNGAFAWVDGTQDRLPELTGDNRFVASGDVDGDGDVDLVLAIGFAENLLLVNDGSGAFAAEPLPGGEFETNSLALLDLDLDGALDLFVGNVNAPARVLMNNGAGSYSDETESCLGGDFSYQVERVLPGDLDGDGDPDLLLLCSGSQPERMLRNEGESLADVTEAALPADTLMAASGSLGSIDGEGPPDLVFDSFISSQPLTLWVNDGSGTFTDGSERLGDPVESMGFDARFVDLNQDGHLDIFEGTMMNLQRVLLNDGSGHFTPLPGAVPATLGPTGNGVLNVFDVEAGDLNLDGAPDVLLGCGGNTPGYNRNHLLLGAGTGALAAYPEFPDPEDGGDTRHARFVDIDGDGDLDIFIVNALSQCRLYLND